MRREPGLERKSMPVRLLRTVVDTARNTHTVWSLHSRVPEKKVTKALSSAPSVQPSRKHRAFNEQRTRFQNDAFARSRSPMQHGYQNSLQCNDL
eukprot:98643-Prymnesium_polylepis.1